MDHPEGTAPQSPALLDTMTRPTSAMPDCHACGTELYRLLLPRLRDVRAVMADQDGGSVPVSTSLCRSRLASVESADQDEGSDPEKRLSFMMSAVSAVSSVSSLGSGPASWEKDRSRRVTVTASTAHETPNQPARHGLLTPSQLTRLPAESVQ